MSTVSAGTRTKLTESSVMTTLINSLVASKDTDSTKVNKISGKFKIKTRNGIYMGFIKDGKRDGIGMYIFDQGGSYFGHWKNGLFDGSGIRKYHNGDEYVGFFHEGKFSGKGKFVYYNGNIYDGQWTCGRQEGIGLFKTKMKKEVKLDSLDEGDENDEEAEEYHIEQKMNESDNQIVNIEQIDNTVEITNGKDEDKHKDNVREFVYEKVYYGNWSKGKQHGHGKYKNKDGLTYVGEWYMGLRHGKGTSTHPKNGTYTGEHVRNRFCGYGKLEKAHVSRREHYVYEGLFQKSKKHGHGKQTLYNSNNTMIDIYEGDWNNGIRCGKGSMIKCDGTKYFGEWINNNIISGKIVYKNGDIYEGIIDKKNPHGYGTYSYNGNVYTGSFTKGKYDGFGVLETVSGIKHSGTWQNSKLVKKH
jgi:hypothetical protein